MDLPVMPRVSPMLAKAVKGMPTPDSTPPGLLYEPKWDSECRNWRCLAHLLPRDRSAPTGARAGSSKAPSAATQIAPLLLAATARCGWGERPDAGGPSELIGIGNA